MTETRCISVSVDAVHTVDPLDALGVLVQGASSTVAVAVRNRDEGNVALMRRAFAEAAVGAMTEVLRDAWAPVVLDNSESISIVICTRERPALLARLLDSLRAFVGLEVIVVDNNPATPRTADVVRSHPTVRYFVEPVAGLDVARNTGWRHASGGWIAYLDDDVVVDHTWLIGLRRALATWPDVGAVTGLILPWTLATDAQLLFEQRGGFRRGMCPWIYRGAFIESDTLFPVGSGRFGAGCNMVIRRTVLAAIGGFDDALDTGAPLPGGGDLDIFFRVLNHGVALAYEPGMSVRHEHRTDLDSLANQYHSWGLGFFAYLDAVRVRDPRRAAQVRGMIRWWVVNWAQAAVASLFRRIDVPLVMIILEGLGALEGWFGEYARSRARMDALRKARR